MKIIGITQARVGSSRLPGKVLMKVNGKSLLAQHLERAANAELVNKWIVATTHEAGSEEICSIAANCGAGCYKGDTNDVLGRFYHAAFDERADYVVRITSDCPLIDPRVIDEVTRYAIGNELVYAATSEVFPDGVDVEIFSSDLLVKAFREATLLSDREHVTPFIRRHANEQHLAWQYQPDSEKFAGIRMTVDELCDYEAVSILIGELGSDRPWQEYSDFIIKNPLLFRNQKVIRNEGFIKSLANDKIEKH